jgi:hypothetical protein
MTATNQSQNNQHHQAAVLANYQQHLSGLPRDVVKFEESCLALLWHKALPLQTKTVLLHRGVILGLSKLKKVRRPLQLELIILTSTTRLCLCPRTALWTSLART